MMEALKKLREWGDSHLSGEQEEFWSLYNGIGAEVDERYMPLPLDADGVPIHVKMVISDDGEHSAYVYKLPNVLHEIYCYETAHAKPDPVKELLKEFGESVARKGHQIGLDLDDMATIYADKLREAMGVGE